MVSLISIITLSVLVCCSTFFYGAVSGKQTVTKSWPPKILTNPWSKGAVKRTNTTDVTDEGLKDHPREPNTTASSEEAKKEDLAQSTKVNKGQRPAAYSYFPNQRPFPQQVYGPPQNGYFPPPSNGQQFGSYHPGQQHMHLPHYPDMAEEDLSDSIIVQPATLHLLCTVEEPLEHIQWLRLPCPGQFGNGDPIAEGSTSFDTNLYSVDIVGASGKFKSTLTVKQPLDPDSGGLYRCEAWAHDYHNIFSSHDEFLVGGKDTLVGCFSQSHYGHQQQPHFYQRPHKKRKIKKRRPYRPKYDTASSGSSLTAFFPSEDYEDETEPFRPSPQIPVVDINAHRLRNSHFGMFLRMENSHGSNYKSSRRDNEPKLIRFEDNDNLETIKQDGKKSQIDPRSVKTYFFSNRTSNTVMPNY